MENSRTRENPSSTRQKRRACAYYALTSEAVPRRKSSGSRASPRARLADDTARCTAKVATAPSTPPKDQLAMALRAARARAASSSSAWCSRRRPGGHSHGEGADGDGGGESEGGSEGGSEGEGGGGGGDDGGGGGDSAAGEGGGVAVWQSQSGSCGGQSARHCEYHWFLRQQTLTPQQDSPLVQLW